jgi:hypothetical protein
MTGGTESLERDFFLKEALCSEKHDGSLFLIADPFSAAGGVCLNVCFLFSAFFSRFALLA